MGWHILFTRDPVYDVVEARFVNVVLETHADVLRWRREVEKHLASYGRKVDLLIELDGLIVKPEVALFFGEQRRQVLERFTRRSFRYGGNTSTRQAVHESAKVYGASANVYPTRSLALAALLEDRRKARQ